jgi:ABC-type lipoprotein release transport system permease subunit
MFTAVLFNYLSSVQAETLAPHALEITYVTWAIIGFSTAAFLLASLLATHRAGKMRLAEVLRIRGG